MLLQRFLGGVDQAFALVPRLHQFTALLVFLGIGLGFLDHLLDIGIREAARGLDADGLLLARCLVLRRDIHDAVGVDVEGHLDLRHAARRGGQPFEVEAAEQLVVRRHLALTLIDLDGHGRLAIFRRGEDLALLGGDRGIAVDEAGEHATQRLDAE